MSEIVETKLGKMLDQVKNKGEPRRYLRNVNVRWGAFDLSDLGEMRVTEQEEAQLSVSDGDIFVCEGGEPGRAAVWRNGENNLVFQKALHRLRPRDLIEPDFISIYLAHSARNGLFNHLLTGTTIKHLPQDALLRMLVPLPPYAEQRRIVVKLNALTAYLARARAELKWVEALVSKLRAAVLGDAFGLLPAAHITVSDIVLDVRYGTAKKCDYGLGATPVLRIPNVQAGKVELSDIKSADFDEKELRKLSIVPGDILIIRSNGSPSLVGRSAVAQESARGMLYAGYLIRLRLDQKKCLPDYLHLFLQSRLARQAIEVAARSTSGVHNINAQQLQALTLPLPSLDAQKAVLSRAQAIFARADRLESEAARAGALLDRLEAAILAKAFQGKLVPQDPTDEPAAVLLKRIRAERTANPFPGRKRPRRALAS